MCGWCLIWAYSFIGLAGTTGFTIFAGKLLDMVHISIPPAALFALCIGICFALSYFDIKLSIIIPLVLEAFSCLAILVLCYVVLSKHHFAIDKTQFDFKDASVSSLGLGLVVAIFSLVGFESSTAFGEEATDPLKTIPKSIIWSLIATGLFFVLVCYVEVLGTAGYKDTLDKIDAPLNVLSEMYAVPYLSPILSAGAMFSFFALALSCLNSGARIIYSMGKHQFFPEGASVAHPIHSTPHVALLFMASIMYAVVTICSAGGMAVLDEFNDAGTMGAFGFLGAYIMITIAAPVFLKKRGEMKTQHVVLCVVTMLLMLIPAVGSVYPVPSAPVNAFPYIFGFYLLIGFVRIIGVKEHHPERVKEIGIEVHKLHSGMA
jgi:amino acid transporter